MTPGKAGRILAVAIGIAMLAPSCDNDKQSEKGASFSEMGSGTTTTASGGLNFIDAARSVTPGVVHVRTIYEAEVSNDPFEQLLGPQQPGAPVNRGSGSGVTLTPDGYIATNNHVVEGASRIEVVYPDRRSFVATLVGRDPGTDLALLKIDGKGLPTVKMGNSDNVQVGEWVLAVGYPFSLNTTATAGIISAKGRSIGIINQPSAEPSPNGEVLNAGIESFIQTDAAINPGNSGGALVNTAGELIGINTAIASLTGSYAGYAFAIPVNLAKKILDDLRQFKTVKRGVLGVTFPAPLVEERYLRQQGIDPSKVKGVLVTGIQPGSAAAAAGLKEGDIIQSINGVRIFSSAEFSERIARQRPGDTIKLTYVRNGREREASVVLKGEEASRPSEGAAQNLQDIYERLGASFAPLSEGLKQRYDTDAGVVVSEVRPGGFFDQLGIPRGMVIVQVNGRAVYTPEDINEALMAARNGRVQILGIAPDGSRVAFVFSLGT